MNARPSLEEIPVVRRLKRNQRTAVLGGVAAGLGDYFDVDPVLMRLGFVLLTFVSAIGLLRYLLGDHADR